MLSHLKKREGRENWVGWVQKKKVYKKKMCWRNKYISEVIVFCCVVRLLRKVKKMNLRPFVLSHLNKKTLAPTYLTRKKAKRVMSWEGLEDPPSSALRFLAKLAFSFIFFFCFC